jgi:hypothetical protein
MANAKRHSVRHNKRRNNKSRNNKRGKRGGKNTPDLEMGITKPDAVKTPSIPMYNPNDFNQNTESDKITDTNTNTTNKTPGQLFSQPEGWDKSVQKQVADQVANLAQVNSMKRKHEGIDIDQLLQKYKDIRSKEDAKSKEDECKDGSCIVSGGRKSRRKRRKGRKSRKH